MARNQSLLLGFLALITALTALVLFRSYGDPPPGPARKAERFAEPPEVSRELATPSTAAEVATHPELQETERRAVEDSRGDLRVLVLDRVTSLPLAGVPLELEQVASASVVNGLTDAGGRYRFPALQPGEYTLRPGPRGDLDFQADPTSVTAGDAVLEEFVIRVERRWFLAGVVLEAGSLLPVPNVSLMARTQVGKRSRLATSTNDGRFRSRKSYAAGTLTLFLSEAETRGLVRTSGPGPDLLQVTVGEADVTRLTVELDWVGVLRGVVLDARDRPIPDAAVRVLSGDSIYLRNASLRFWSLYENMGSGGRTSHSDAQGRFSFDRLPNDRNLVLVASAPGFASGRSRDLSPPFLKSGDPVEVRLTSGGSIVGRVLDAAGAPMDAVTVTALFPDADYQPDPTRTDEQGAFRLAGLKPGATEVTALVQRDGGRRHAIASGEVVVRAGEEVELILRAGADGVHLSGIAVDQDGRVITSDRAILRLRATPLEPLPGEEAWGADSPLQSDGTFNITVARPAGYRLTLLSGMAGNQWESLDVQAPAHGLRIPFSIVPLSELTVLIVDAASGKPISEGGLSLYWGKGSSGGGFFGGKHTTRIRQGLYTLTVDATGYAPMSQELDLRDLQDPEIMVEMRLGRGRPLSGIVMDSAGQPVKGSTIVLRTGGMLQLKNLVYSGADGRFAIACVPTTGGSVCVIDASYRTLAVAEIGTGDVVLRIDGDR